MKIMVAVENGAISDEVGKCKQFLIVETEHKAVTRQYTVEVPGNGITSMFSFFSAQAADILICGDISRRAKNTLQMLGLILIPGVSGKPEDAVQRLLSGEKIGNDDLLADPETEYAEDDPMSCMHDCEKCTAGGSSKFHPPAGKTPS